MVNELLDISSCRSLFLSQNINKIKINCPTGNSFRDKSNCRVCHEYKCPIFYDDKDWIEMINDAYSLIKTSKIAYLTSLQQTGEPFSRTMLNLFVDGLDVVWFGTFLTSRKVIDFKTNKKACILYSDNSEYKSVTMVGEIDIFTDYESKKKIWRDGFEMYYPNGIGERDYCALKFSTKSISYYHGIKEWKFLLNKL